MKKGEKMTEIQKIKIRRNRKNKGIGNKNRLGKIPWNKDKKGLQSAWNKGITPSKETSKKMVETRRRNGNYIAWNKGKKNPDMIGNTSGFRKGNKPWNKDKPITDKTRKKISDKLKGKKPWNKNKKSLIPKEKHWNYQGGITPENRKVRNSLEIKIWRKAVFERDNYTCQKYGIRGGSLVAHHINNFADFSELRTSIENGITLSEKAHKEFHKIYGKRNNTKEQLNEFLKAD